MPNIVLTYTERNFLKKAKDTLRNGESLSVVFQGHHTKFIAKYISLLKEIEKFRLNKKSDVKWWDFLRSYLLLNLRFRPFMVVFWLSIAEGRSMQVLKQADNLVEIVFDKYELDNNEMTDGNRDSVH